MNQNEKIKLVPFLTQCIIKVLLSKRSAYLLLTALLSLSMVNTYAKSDKDNNQKLKKSKNTLAAKASHSKSQARQVVTVSGKITDINGNSLPGVNISEKNTTNGTVSDLDGNFTITVSSKESVLSISSLGYVAEEILVGDQTVINLSMSEDLVGLDEIVVVGYGTMKKSDVTGSISSVSSEQINEMPVTNVNQAIQGRAAGVDVVNSSYGLNSSPTIRIRGNRSIAAGNDPLYVVDGVVIAGTIADFNPSDIESIEILKDASTTAVYGSRASNGVVLVTTKRGKSGRFAVNLESSISIKNPLVFYDELSGGDWMEIARDNQRGRGRYDTPYPNWVDDYDIVGDKNYTTWQSVAMGYEFLDQSSDNPEEWVVATREVTDEERERWSQFMDEVPDEVPVYNADNVRTYDWYDNALNENALTQTYNFSASGGSEKVSAFFSVGYVDEEGLGIGERFQRITPRLNLDLQPLKWLKFGLSTTYSSEITDPGEGLISAMANQLPISLPYDTAGNYIYYPSANDKIVNAVNDEELNVHENRVNRFMGAYWGQILFTDHLSYKLSVSLDNRQYRNGEYLDDESSTNYLGDNEATYSTGNLFHYSVENIIFYNKQIGIHKFDVTLLQSIEATRQEQLSATATSIPNSSSLWYDLYSTTDPDAITISQSGDYSLPYYRSQLASYMGRINYSLLDKYLVTASLRYDGTSRFYRDNQWDFFPSFSLGWKLHNEDFMRNIRALSQLKLRFGYGTTGAQAVKPYESSGTIAESVYVFGETSAKGYAPSTIQTWDVGWEKSATTNIGLDFGLFQNRISGVIELYRTTTSDLLLDAAVPGVTGYTTVRGNVGKTRNEGIELTLTTYNINKGDFRWETDFTFTKNREQILELESGAESDIENGWFIGEAITSYYTYKYDGIWQISDSVLMNKYNENGSSFEVGDIKVKDIDGNDTINTLDQTVVGNNVPDYSGGITNRFYYKGFELSFFVYFRIGASIYSRDGHYPLMSTDYNVRYSVNYYDPNATEEENADATHPIPSNSRDQYAEALYVQDASFVKVRHITLSYNIPESLLSKAKINSLKLSVQLNNPFLFTDYDYLDPEAQASNKLYIPSGFSTKGVTFNVKIGL